MKARIMDAPTKSLFDQTALLNQPFGAVEEGGLVEQGFGGRVHDSGFHFRDFY